MIRTRIAVIIVVLCIAGVPLTLTITNVAAQGNALPLTASKTEVKVNEPVTFVATFSQCTKNNPTGLTCELTFQTLDGTFSETKSTDANGQASFSYTPMKAGTYSFQANGHYSAPPGTPVPAIAMQSNVVSITVTEATVSGSDDGSGGESGSGSGSRVNSGNVGGIISGLQSILGDDSGSSSGSAADESSTGSSASSGSAWFWLFTIVIIIFLVVVAVLLLITRRRPRYDHEDVLEERYEERRRRRY